MCHFASRCDRRKGLKMVRPPIDGNFNREHNGKPACFGGVTPFSNPNIETSLPSLTLLFRDSRIHYLLVLHLFRIFRLLMAGPGNYEFLCPNEGAQR